MSATPWLWVPCLPGNNPFIPRVDVEDKLGHAALYAGLEEYREHLADNVVVLHLDPIYRSNVGREKPAGKELTLRECYLECFERG